jgi:hypothetical protein
MIVCQSPDWTTRGCKTPFFVYDNNMKNTHLEHPEDEILTNGLEGVKNILKFLRDRNSKLSVKWDGAPAIVWGTCPFTGRFFVGTKSVFNKKKIKINYSHYDIEVNHGDVPKVASILHVCFDNLPRIEGIVQGDFIGFGGNDFYQPNTIEYNFGRLIRENVIIAAHTSYTSSTHLKDAVASFGVTENLDSDKVKFLNTNAKFSSRRNRIDLLLSLAGFMLPLVVFPDRKEGERLKVEVNRCIREQRDIAECGMNRNLMILYKFIIEIKELLMEGITSDEDVECFIGDDKCDHEGYVMTNKFGTFKLINRRQFSYANFTLRKEW